MQLNKSSTVVVRFSRPIPVPLKHQIYSVAMAGSGAIPVERQVEVTCGPLQDRTTYWLILPTKGHQKAATLMPVGRDFLHIIS